MSRPTYTINGDGQSITCHDCGMTSWHPGDIENRYCGNCHEFHADKEIRRLNAEELKARIEQHFATTTAEEVVARAEQIARESDCD